MRVTDRVLGDPKQAGDPSIDSVVRVARLYALTERRFAQLIRSDVLERYRVKRRVVKAPLRDNTLKDIERTQTI
jgi:hypothetical protein